MICIFNIREIVQVRHVLTLGETQFGLSEGDWLLCRGTELTDQPPDRLTQTFVFLHAVHLGNGCICSGFQYMSESSYRGSQKGLEMCSTLATFKIFVCSHYLEMHMMQAFHSIKAML